MFGRVAHYLKKVSEYGLLGSVAVLRNRVEALWGAHILRSRAGLSHTWAEIGQGSFEQFWHKVARLHVPSESVDIAVADRYVRKEFNVLGSGWLSFERVPWHTDIRLHARNKSADAIFDACMFYKDMHVSAGVVDEIKDIKVPWELSRAQHLVVLARAYAQTSDEKYARACIEQLLDWIDTNAYMCGPNWVCPMDVGLRAISWIHAIAYMRDASFISVDVWQRITCSLYDHMVHLEHNWEKYDGRTSNHYLSDIVGYAYLCHFFAPLSIVHKRDWVIDELELEMKKQVFAEGTDYEGSTGYHRLVTELFYQGQYIAQQMGYSLSEAYNERLDRMRQFVGWCSVSEGNYVYIGDHDSGSVLPEGIAGVCPTASSMYYPDFGVSFVRTARLQVSLRHQRYAVRQPSGHFHNDYASITVAVDGHLVITDPGSYVYTPSAYWRDYFRSTFNHNTFYIPYVEFVPFDERLFALDMHQEDGIHGTLHTSHDAYYTSRGIRAYRELSVSDAHLSVKDWWDTHKDIETEWNFTCAAGAAVVLDAHEAIVYISGRPVMRMGCGKELVLRESFVSSAYGVKQACVQIRCRTYASIDTPLIWHFNTL